MMTILLIIILIFCIMLSAILSASETSMFSLSSMAIRASRKSHTSLYNLLQRPKDLLITILMLNVAMNIFVQNIVSNLFGNFSHWLLSVLVPLFLTLIFGELIPKSIAISSNYAIATKVAPFIDRIKKLLGPFRKGLNALTSFLAGVLFFFLKNAEDISVDELKHAMVTSHQYGVLDDEEVRLMRGYLSVDDTIVKEVMRPRGEVVMFSTNQSLDNLRELFATKEYSRIPVYEGSRDNVIGTISVDRFLYNQKQINSIEDLKKYLFKPFFVPDTMPTKSLLHQFLQTKRKVAIVVDEYGQLVGIITKEDLVEIIIGQIQDKKDALPLYSRSGKDVIIASGKLELSEFEDIFHIPLESEQNMATIGGWLTEKLGDIPRAGIKYEYGQFTFQILQASKTHVQSVYIRRLSHKRGVGERS